MRSIWFKSDFEFLKIIWTQSISIASFVYTSSDQPVKTFYSEFQRLEMPIWHRDSSRRSQALVDGYKHRVGPSAAMISNSPEIVLIILLVLFNSIPLVTRPPFTINNFGNLKPNLNFPDFLKFLSTKTPHSSAQLINPTKWIWLIQWIHRFRSALSPVI